MKIVWSQVELAQVLSIYFSDHVDLNGVEMKVEPAIKVSSLNEFYTFTLELTPLSKGLSKGDGNG